MRFYIYLSVLILSSSCNKELCVPSEKISVSENLATTRYLDNKTYCTIMNDAFTKEPNSILSFASISIKDESYYEEHSLNLIQLIDFVSESVFIEAIRNELTENEKLMLKTYITLGAFKSKNVFFYSETIADRYPLLNIYLSPR